MLAISKYKTDSTRGNIVVRVNFHSSPFFLALFCCALVNNFPTRIDRIVHVVGLASERSEIEGDASEWVQSHSIWPKAPLSEINAAIIAAWLSTGVFGNVVLNKQGRDNGPILGSI
jgi:hypothetical protein